MPNLSCGVDNCAYNQNDMCSLNSIKVNGSFANHSEATCCEALLRKVDLLTLLLIWALQSQQLALHVKLRNAATIKTVNVMLKA